jgi:hypothetical protein
LNDELIYYSLVVVYKASIIEVIIGVHKSSVLRLEWFRLRLRLVIIELILREIIDSSLIPINLLLGVDVPFSRFLSLLMRQLEHDSLFPSLAALSGAACHRCFVVSLIHS